MVGGGGSRIAPLLMVAAQTIVLLFFQPSGAAADFLSPLFSPSKDASCDHALCGKGTCKPSDDNPFLGLVGLDFTCECDPGWKRLYNNNDTFRFLPCVFPDCSIKSSCSSEAPAAAAPPPPSLNQTFDICSLPLCGDGACVKLQTSLFSYRCDCGQGTRNLLNLSYSPCFQDCVLGDCSQFRQGSSEPPPSDSSTTTSASPPGSASKSSEMNMLWLSVLVMISVASMA